MKYYHMCTYNVVMYTVTQLGVVEGSKPCLIWVMPAGCIVAGILSEMLLTSILNLCACLGTLVNAGPFFSSESNGHGFNDTACLIAGGGFRSCKGGKAGCQNKRRSSGGHTGVAGESHLTFLWKTTLS